MSLGERLKQKLKSGILTYKQLTLEELEELLDYELNLLEQKKGNTEDVRICTQYMNEQYGLEQVKEKQEDIYKDVITEYDKNEENRQKFRKKFFYPRYKVASIAILFFLGLAALQAVSMARGTHILHLFTRETKDDCIYDINNEPVEDVDTVTGKGKEFYDFDKEYDDLEKMKKEYPEMLYLDYIPEGYLFEKGEVHGSEMDIWYSVSYYKEDTDSRMEIDLTRVNPLEDYSMSMHITTEGKLIEKVMENGIEFRIYGGKDPVVVWNTDKYHYFSLWGEEPLNDIKKIIQEIGEKE